MIHTLFLGDSYTIGEGVPLFDNYPSQLIHLLRQAGLPCAAPEIIAKTGYTSDELLGQIANTIFLPTYDFVMLLIGVNNEYRGRDTEPFKADLETLVQKAISLCLNKEEGVIMLNIPDYGRTPFVEAEKKPVVAERIDWFNSVCHEVAQKYNTGFIDVCSLSRHPDIENGYLASDNLHYSGKAYKEWANLVFEKIIRS